MLGKVLTTILLENTEIVNTINNRLYPMSSLQEGLSSVYYNVSCIPHYNNNGQQMQDWQVTILTMCKTYAEAWELSRMIQNAFHAKRRRKVSNVTFAEIRCTLIRDDYEFQVNSYGQILEFDIKTNNLV